MKRTVSFRAPRIALHLFLLLLSVLFRVSGAAEWRVDLDVSNGAGVTRTIAFGVHPNATAGVDAELGEVCLPPWPPSSLFEARFMVSGCDGLQLDLRDTTQTQRIHTIKWQAGEGGYPVTVRWDRMSMPYGSFYISDGYGGVFLPPRNMYEVDSLQVPVSMSYISQLTLTVIPGVSPGAQPEASEIPDASVYVGQQFPEYHLDNYVFDPDTPDSMIQWFVTGNHALILEIGQNRVLRIRSPEGWTGSEAVTFTARDPEHHADQTTAAFSVIRGGLPTWTVPVTVLNDSGETRTVRFGINPAATDAIDAGLGEVALPPWPPQAVFDTRFLLPDGFTYTAKDVRESSPETISYHLKWQAGDGGYPITVSWSNHLPLGSFIIKDDMGGVFIPPTDMSAISELVIPPEQSFVTGLVITAEAVVDTMSPIGPESLIFQGGMPGVSVILEWDQCIEEHFSYYEILYDTVYFDDEASFVWDWTEDSTLTHKETISATVLLPYAEKSYVFRIRAWDIFGNVSVLSSPVVHAPEDLRTPRVSGLFLSVWPNPFEASANIRFSTPANEPITIVVSDVAGHIVKRYNVKPASSGFGQVNWDGGDLRGQKVSAGIYFCRLETSSGSVCRKLLLLR